jgi:antitoxin component of RelBE/YafQ-DinJ toxin-antitoxin module
MGTTVQARLDEETLAALALLRRQGLSTSEVIRKAIHLAAEASAMNKPIEIVGLGKYDFGVDDLSTNKKYLAGLGRSSMPGGKSRRKPKGR